MQKISDDRKKELLKQVIWDYDVSGDILLNILEKKLDAYVHINREHLINRCFNYLNWYQFVSLFNEDELLEAVMELDYKSDKWNKSGKNTKQGLEFARKFLQREALSGSGQSSSNP